MVNFDYLYNPDAAKPYFTKNYFVDKKLGFQVIENGIILPHKDFITVNGKSTHGKGGIIDSKGEYVKESFAVPRLSKGSYTPSPESIQHSSETVIYFDMLYSVWGHLITDNLKRLWFFRSEYFKQFKNCPIVYTVLGNKDKGRQLNFFERNKTFKRLLEILEFDVSKLQEVMQPTQFERIILPDSSFLSLNFSDMGSFTTEYRETIDIVRNFALKNRTPTSSRKIYFFYGRRNQIGEERHAEYFKSKGYEIIRPETLNFDEQLNALINCESLASPLGSCAHNSVFLRDGTETIFIPRSAINFSDYQKALDQVHPSNTNYVDANMSIFASYNSDFCFIISEQLKRFFGEKWNGYEEDDFKTFLQYVKDSMARGLAINPTIKKRCAPILEDFMAQLKQREDLITAYNMPPRWETSQPTLSYQTHIAKKGWIAWQNEEQISGSTKDNLDIQAVRIKFLSHKIYYSVYYNQEEGWSTEVSNGEQAGTTGKTKAIYGIKIRLEKAGQKEFDVLYRVHKFDGAWTDWAKNGEMLYSYGQKLNALQIKLEPKS